MYFVVLAPSGFSVTVEPYDEERATFCCVRKCTCPDYVQSSLLPALLDFWTDHLVPAFEEREARSATEQVPVGWVPAKVGATRKRAT